MGNDEHGPAYPEPPYRCPICRGDENRYLSCEYPGCPDGRDRRHPHRFVPPVEPERTKAIEPTEPPLWQRMLMCLVVIGILAWLFHK